MVLFGGDLRDRVSHAEYIFGKTQFLYYAVKGGSRDTALFGRQRYVSVTFTEQAGEVLLLEASEDLLLCLVIVGDAETFCL